MKKVFLVILMAIVFDIFITSCSSAKEEATSTTDSTLVDSVKVVKVDTAKVDTVKVK